MSSSDIAISVRGLGKSYTIAHNQEKHHTLGAAISARLRDPFRRAQTETFQALKDVTFDIREGEVLGIIGRNGAGKSTLLKVLSRIVEPTTGEIDVYGRVGSLLEVGTGFHQELTGRENVFLNGAILGMSRAEIRKQFDAIVDFAGVEKFIDTPVKRYSSGMYVRLAFAVAAHLNPEILILDEVLAVGDTAFQERCLGKMKDIASAGRTVLFVSHNMAAVRQLCKSALLLKAGELVYSGNVADALSMYAAEATSKRGRILGHVSKSEPDLEVSAIRLNGSDSDELHLSGRERDVTVDIDFRLIQPQRVELEIFFHHATGGPLGLFSPGRETPMILTRPVGEHRISYVIRLPRLNRGEYYFDIWLTDPNCQTWVEVPHAVRIYAEGTPMANGQVFDSTSRDGPLFLDATELLAHGPNPALELQAAASSRQTV
jgi:ABC-type polysaccharide/polyol phosphate transport system ATPase subunit